MVIFFYYSTIKFREMKKIKIVLVSLLLLSIFSCSDGAQIGQKINQLIEERNIESIVILTETTSGELKKKEIKIDEDTFENQFIQLEDEYINMGRIKTMKVIGNKLEVKI